MDVSFAVTCKDEVQEISNLIHKLRRYCGELLTPYEWQIVILQDGDDADMSTFLQRNATDDIKWHHHELCNNFAAHKNVLNACCQGEFIFQLDADEYPSSILVSALGMILRDNANTDLIWVPRVNIVAGITDEHIAQWRWRKTKMEELGDIEVVNWPDYQSRIYRRSENIRWELPVHEHIEGVTTYTFLPQEPQWAIFHEKTIERQIRQNQYYMTFAEQRVHA